MRDQEDRESEQWKEHFADILLNIEDDLVKVDWTINSFIIYA